MKERGRLGFIASLLANGVKHCNMPGRRARTGKRTHGYAYTGRRCPEGGPALYRLPVPDGHVAIIDKLGKFPGDVVGFKQLAPRVPVP